MGQVRFENFDFLVKVKTPLGQSIFSFFFFSFFEAVRTRSDFRVGPGRIWTNGSAVDDVIHDVTMLRARATCAARVARASAWLGEVVRKLKAATAESFGSAWRRVRGFLG